MQLHHGLREQGEGASLAQGQGGGDLPAALQRKPSGRDHLHVGGAGRQRWEKPTMLYALLEVA